MTGPSIPASQLITVNPSVIAAAGSGVQTNGLYLTASTRVPIGTVLSLPSLPAVTAYFGGGSAEESVATKYFLGFLGSSVKPGAVLFVQYPSVAVPAYLRGGNISGLTLAQLQAITGVLTVTIDGQSFISGTINLSGAASFSAAAALIQTALAAKDAVVTGSITTTTLTVTAVSSGTLAVGQVISGSGITAGTTITALGSGTGGTGTYTVSVSQTASSTSITAGAATVTYDSVSGAFIITGGTPGAAGTITFATGTISAGLALTAATGAVISQGAAIGTPAAAMNAIIAKNQNFVSFKTIAEPTTADKIAFSAWNTTQNNRYLYAMSDTDITVTTNANTASAGYAITTAGYSGTAMMYEPSALGIGSFLMGAIASINWAQLNGRLNLAYTQQSGLTPGVTDAAIAAQLLLNGYNFYGNYGFPQEQDACFQNGSVTGPYLWIDSYINQIKLNADLQLAMFKLLLAVRRIPYNTAGNAMIESAAQDPIKAAVNFGTISENVTLSDAQIAEVNNQAGLEIDAPLSQRGWYLQILPTPPAIRAQRGSPPITFWYMDGESVNKINISSLLIQ